MTELHQKYFLQMKYTPQKNYEGLMTWKVNIDYFCRLLKIYLETINRLFCGMLRKYSSSSISVKSSVNILKPSFKENLEDIFDFNSSRLWHATPFLFLRSVSKVILNPFIFKYLGKHITFPEMYCQLAHYLYLCCLLQNFPR